VNLLVKPALALQATWTFLALLGALLTLLVTAWAALWGGAGGALVYSTVAIPLVGVLGLLAGVPGGFSRRPIYAWTTGFSAFVIACFAAMVLFGAARSGTPNPSFNATSVVLFLVFALIVNLVQILLSAAKILQLSPPR